MFMIKKEEGVHSNFKRNLIIIVSISLIIFLILFFYPSNVIIEKIPTCGDDSFYETCSLNKPYYCSEGVLIEKASICKCPNNLTKQGDSCLSNYQTKPKEINLKYILRGEEGEINYKVYGGEIKYLSNVSKTITYWNEEIPSRRDFKLKNINEETQRQLLLPLVVKIQNSADNENDRVRIAVSAVQNIPFGSSNKTTIIGKGLKTNYSRYSSEVLYDFEGVCGEKVELLAFLLREMGYGLAFFYYSEENHEALGIKCPVEYSVGNTGYCFVETTGPSIITDNTIEYADGIKLNSKPEVFLISRGASLSGDLYEYVDAKDLIKIREDIEEDGKLNLFKSSRFEKLKEKYGLVGEYNAE